MKTQIKRFKMNKESKNLYNKIIHNYSLFYAESKEIKKEKEKSEKEERLFSLIKSHEIDYYGRGFREFGEERGLSSSEVKEMEVLLNEITKEELNKKIKSIIKSEKKYKYLISEFKSKFSYCYDEMIENFNEFKKTIQDDYNEKLKKEEKIRALSKRVFSFYSKFITKSDINVSVSMASSSYVNNLKIENEINIKEMKEIEFHYYKNNFLKINQIEKIIKELDKIIEKSESVNIDSFVATNEKNNVLFGKIVKKELKKMKKLKNDYLILNK